ncbi:Cell division control protein 1 [Neolecta irregularis DAH-3]|uniref:Cell division control protein 1 n=1 Tax=Neolecta irregularis (strain DAH-3) TaxID=1198029 RepID=A0A1U7LT36_NEOID|nr:Cell division control protein 1 [Neolecta irregularis DAH-3]|eukprot:OLL25835.1 Cell division control protein 1 [Neolecta irregularis DAH-3]
MRPANVPRKRSASLTFPALSLVQPPNYICLLPPIFTPNIASFRPSTSLAWFRISFPFSFSACFLFYLFIFWFVLLLWGEGWGFSLAVQRCEWERWESWNSDAIPHRLVIIADPQIVDESSYPNRSRLLLHLTKLYSDVYMRRSFERLRSHLLPETVIFVGDNMDGGRSITLDQYYSSFERFDKIFPPRQDYRLLNNIPGNHDIGFGEDVIEESLIRFEKFFGMGSEMHIVGNHSMVMLDTISMSNESKKTIYGPAWEYFEHMANLCIPKLSCFTDKSNAISSNSFPSCPFIQSSRISMWSFSRKARKDVVYFNSKGLSVSKCLDARAVNDIATALTTRGRV